MKNLSEAKTREKLIDRDLHEDNRNSKKTKMKKILIINGQPKKSGLSFFISNNYIKGIRKENAIVRKIDKLFIPLSLYFL